MAKIPGYVSVSPCVFAIVFGQRDLDGRAAWNRRCRQSDDDGDGNGTVHGTERAHRDEDSPSRWGDMKG
jgi:hypothetical protein